MLSANLPALQVVLPLIAAPISMLLRGIGWSWLWAMLVTWASFGISCLLLGQVLDGGTISYALGGWAAPYGIEYRVDEVSAFVLLIVSGIGSVVMPFARASVRQEFGHNRDYMFYTMYLLALAGLLGVAITGDAFNLFVFLEISSLSSYALISLGRDRRALTAAYQYLILGTIGATFIVIGIGLLYHATGTLNMADLSTRITATDGRFSRVLVVAFAFLVVGTCLKLALFPLHLWLPNAYTYAPSMVSAFLAATATKVGVYMLLRFVFTIFGLEFAFGEMPLGPILGILAILAMFAGATVAVFQENIKRMLAYSSVSQIGYMVLGVSFASATGLTAGILHLFNHALMKGGLFLALGCVMFRLGSVMLDDMRGLGRRMPLTMAAFVTGGLSLIGVPLTAGFISKWVLIQAALEAGWWPIAVLVVAASLIAVIYVWRVVEAAYFQEPPEGAAKISEAPLGMLIPTWILIGANVYFGIDTSLSIGVAERAAQALLGGGS